MGHTCNCPTLIISIRIVKKQYWLNIIKISSFYRHIVCKKVLQHLYISVFGTNNGVYCRNAKFDLFLRIHTNGSNYFFQQTQHELFFNVNWCFSHYLFMKISTFKYVPISSNLSKNGQNHIPVLCFFISWQTGVWILLQFIGNIPWSIH